MKEARLRALKQFLKQHTFDLPFIVEIKEAHMKVLKQPCFCKNHKAPTCRNRILFVNIEIYLFHGREYCDREKDDSDFP